MIQQLLDTGDTLLAFLFAAAAIAAFVLALRLLARGYYVLFKRPGYRRHELAKRDAERWADRRETRPIRGGAGPGR